MFIGSINRYMRVVLESAASQWRGQDIYVACSGNFTVERILSRCGVGRIFSNDVSIYSCALGWHLANASQPSVNPPHPFVIKASEFNWLSLLCHYRQFPLSQGAGQTLGAAARELGDFAAGAEYQPLA